MSSDILTIYNLRKQDDFTSKVTSNNTGWFIRFIQAWAYNY